VQARGEGDWQVNRPKLQPGGWFFEYQNGHTRHRRLFDGADGASPGTLDRSKRLQESIRRGTNWMLGMQGAEGGFAAFDVDNDHLVFCQVPFADHNAMLDPACPDITGRVLESLAMLATRRDRRKPTEPSPGCGKIRTRKAAGLDAGRQLHLRNVLCVARRSRCRRRSSRSLHAARR